MSFGGFLFGILFFICFTVLTVDIVDNTFDNHLFDVYVVAEQTDKTEILQEIPDSIRIPNVSRESALFFPRSFNNFSDSVLSKLKTSL